MSYSKCVVKLTIMYCVVVQGREWLEAVILEEVKHHIAGWTNFRVTLL